MSTFSAKLETPAGRAIKLLGLVDVAHACRLTTDAPRKWARSKGGCIPAQHQAAVLRLAREKGVELKPEDVISGLDVTAGEA